MNREPDGCVDETLLCYVATEVARRAPGFSAVQSDEAASAILMFCAEYGYRDAVPTDYLELLIDRVVRLALGEDRSDFESPEAILTSRRWTGPLSPAIGALFTSGVVRPGWSSIGPGDLSCLLDFTRLNRTGESGLDLFMLPALRAVLEAIAPLWDETRGRGILGLQGLGEEIRKRPRRDGSRDVVRYGSDVLRRVGSERGWEQAPLVIRREASRSPIPGP